MCVSSRTNGKYYHLCRTFSLVLRRWREKIMTKFFFFFFLAVWRRWLTAQWSSQMLIKCKVAMTNWVRGRWSLLRGNWESCGRSKRAMCWLPSTIHRSKLLIWATYLLDGQMVRTILAEICVADFMNWRMFEEEKKWYDNSSKFFSLLFVFQAKREFWLANKIPGL